MEDRNTPLHPTDLHDHDYPPIILIIYVVYIVYLNTICLVRGGGENETVIGVI